MTVSSLPFPPVLDFLAQSPSPFHAVCHATALLSRLGFTPLSEECPWNVLPAGKYVVSRSDTSLIAFILGNESPTAAGFRLIGAHTDSPNLRLKPLPVYSSHGYLQVGVEIYGGVLLYSWLDRDLGIAGRLLFRDHGRQLRSALVSCTEPLFRIPSLAIHLDREVNERGLVLNKQLHMPPILGLGSGESNQSILFRRLCAEVNELEDDLLSFDLGLYDVTPPCVGGVEQEFILSGRLDNLASCHAALSALVHAPVNCPATRLIALFDHEEVGSASAQGAAGSFLESTLRRLVQCTDAGELAAFERAMAKSFCISADMAHAVHPNYADKHEFRHLPHINMGPVLKSNVQQRYASDGFSSAHFRLLCEDAKVPFQNFIARTDLGCGSTIGPITATRLGIPTVDIGSPMLAMHSCREMAGVKDGHYMNRVLLHFFS